MRELTKEKKKLNTKYVCYQLANDGKEGSQKRNKKSSTPSGIQTRSTTNTRLALYRLSPLGVYGYYPQSNKYLQKQRTKLV